MLCSEKWVIMLYAVLTAAMQFRDHDHMKALVKKNEHTEDWLAAYIHVLRVLETDFYGSGGLST